MAADFYLDPATFDISTLNCLRIKWINIPDQNIREVIVREAQYLEFYRFILGSLKHTATGQAKSPTYSHPIGLDLRVIALKTAIVNSSSIMEAALLSHAISRNYKLNKDEKKRTFGNIIGAWEKEQKGKQEPGHFLSLLKWFNSARSHIHLSKITKNDSYFEDMCKKELKYLVVADKVLKFLQNIKSH